MQEKQSSSKIVFHVMQKQETSFRIDGSLNLFFGLGGKTHIIVSEEEYVLSAGGILAVNPERLFRISCIDSSAIMLQIPREILQLAGDAALCTYHCYTPEGRELQIEYQHMRELYATLFYEYLQNHHDVSRSLNSTLMQLLQYLAEHFGEAGDGNGVDPKTEYVIRYIDSHWNEEISLSSLASEVHFSSSYLSRFFQKTTGMNFSSYLRKVRMIHARQMLAQEDISITQIAYDCGFRNASVFIETFKQEYQMTPGQFRQIHPASGQMHAGVLSVHDQRSDLSILLVHMPEKDTSKVTLRKELLEIDCRDREKEDHRWTRMLNIGYAREGLLSDVREQIKRAQTEIGFRYFRCHGLLDDDMYIYGENAEGKPIFSFSYVDLLFDFVTGLGMTPFVELSFMPSILAKEQTRIFDRPSVISGCSDLEKWKLLVRALLQHLADRYGIHALRTWRFATISLSYVRIGCLTLEDYAELYQSTWQTVKDFDPDLQFGGTGCFPDLTDNEQIGLPWFLRFASKNSCLPDFHSIQWYPCVQTDDSLFMEYTLNQRSAPALLSKDPDLLKKKLDELDALFEQYHVNERELFLEECSPTLWQRDLSCDTCYKAVWLAKNMAISAGRAVFGYWLLTDFIGERAHIRSVFHGGYGLFTYNGIPKAGYHAMRLISEMGTELISAGSGYVMTRDGGSGNIQLLIYNYSHYSDINCYRYKQLDDPADACSVFQPGEQMQLRFNLKGLTPGKYRILRYVLNKEHGSSYDLWIRLQAPAYPTTEETAYLRENSDPECSIEVVDCKGNLLLETDRMPLETELICIERT